MQNNILMRIANGLVLNIQQTSLIGLLEGNIGMSLYLYHYAKRNNNEYYSDIASSLLDYTIDHYLNKIGRFFSSGLYGIGWAIWYMRQHGFVEVTDDTFEDFETIVKQNYSKIDIEQDLKSKYPVFSKGLYCVQSGKTEHLKYALDAIDIIRSFEEKKLFTPSYINSILFVIRKIEETHPNVDKLVDNKNFFNSFIDDNPMFYANNDFDLYIAKQLEPSQFKNYSLSENIDILTCGYMNWQSILYKDYIKLPDLSSNAEAFTRIDKILDNASINKMSLDGLSSVGINIIESGID